MVVLFPFKEVGFRGFVPAGRQKNNSLYYLYKYSLFIAQYLVSLKVLLDFIIISLVLSDSHRKVIAFLE